MQVEKSWFGAEGGTLAPFYLEEGRCDRRSHTVFGTDPDAKEACPCTFFGFISHRWI